MGIGFCFPKGMRDPRQLEQIRISPNNQKELDNESCVRYDPDQSGSEAKQLKHTESFTTHQLKSSSGSVKHHAEGNRDGNAAEVTHSRSPSENRNWLKLSATASGNATNTELTDECTSTASNHEKKIRSCQTVSASTAKVNSSSSSKLQIQTGKSCQAQSWQSVQQNNHPAEDKRNKGKQPIQVQMYSANVSKNHRIQHPQGVKQVWQVKEKTESMKDSPQSSRMVWQVKENKQNTTNASKSPAKTNARRKISERKVRIQRIMLDDSDEANEPVGYNCCLCDDDLAFSPTPTDPFFESHNYPEVALLLCGHVFHRVCLEEGMSDEQLKDPPCVICASIS